MHTLYADCRPPGKRQSHDTIDATDVEAALCVWNKASKPVLHYFHNQCQVFAIAQPSKEQTPQLLAGRTAILYPRM